MRRLADTEILTRTLRRRTQPPETPGIATDAVVVDQSATRSRLSLVQDEGAHGDNSLRFRDDTGRTFPHTPVPRQNTLIMRTTVLPRQR